MITLTGLHADHGSIVVFEGIEDVEDDGSVDAVLDARTVLVSVDHRPAQDIWNALVAGEHVMVDPEEWQIRWLT